MPKKFQNNFRRKNVKRHYAESEILIKRVKKESPNSGEYLYNYKIPILKSENLTLPEEDLRKLLKLYFSDLPISHPTINSMKKQGFYKLTEIQRCVIPHALAGRDILAASRTGSGKTLSYIVPIIENLYRKKWNVLDGIGALVILPTRELAIQVFEVFRSLLEKTHDFTFGLLIGGKKIAIERHLISRMNILICTPGRLLQHLNETVDFNCDNLQMLVLDEADEILSLGFSNTLTAILNCIPIDNTQNLLFSATLTKNILGISKIALKNHENILLQDKAITSENIKDIKNIYETPTNLKQFYMTIPHHEKIDSLFSFLKSHQNSKILIFVSTVKQVRFLYESLKRLRLGMPMFEYHGRQMQPKRTAMFFTFKEQKSGLLVSTNISSRGLDFPKVHWVLQMDCPDSVETYVHRIGRTARFNNKGKSLLFIDPSEIRFVEDLVKKKFEVKKILGNPKKQLTIRSSLQGICSENEEIKYLAQRYFISFLRNINRMGNKQIFDVRKIEFNKLAESLGLIQTPTVSFGNGNNFELKNKEEGNKEENNDVYDEEYSKMNKKQKKLYKLKKKIADKKKNKNLLNDKILEKNMLENLNEVRETKIVQRTEKITTFDFKDDNDDDFLKIKRKDDEIKIEEIEIINPLNVSKNQLKRVRPGGIFGGKNIFDIDDEGILVSHEKKKFAQYEKNLKKIEMEDIDLTKKRATIIKNVKEGDKLVDKQRLREKRMYKRTKKYN